MKKAIVIFLLVITNYLNSQTQTGLEICFQLQELARNFTTDKEVDLALEKILYTIGASKNFELVPCDKIRNAAAITFKGDRYILYDKDWISNASSSSNKWSVLFILAHEVGHHINGHTRDFLLSSVLDTEPLEKRRIDELQADEWAAFVVSKLGASLNEIEKIVDFLGSDENDLYSSHPDKAKRLAAVKKGFEKAESQKQIILVESESFNSIKTGEELFNESLPIESNDRVPPDQREVFLEKLETYNLFNKPKKETYNKWTKSSTKRLERRLEKIDLNDPFEVIRAEEDHPVLSIASHTTAVLMNDSGSRNLELHVNQIMHKRKAGLRKRLENFSDEDHIQYMNEMYSEYQKYGFPKNYELIIELYNFLEMPKKNSYLISYDSQIMADFEYYFDNGVSGKITTKLSGWYDANQYIEEYADEVYDRDSDNNGIEDFMEDLIFESKIHYPWPRSINLTEHWYISKDHFKSIMTFFINLKKANILYLRLDEAYVFNGYDDEDNTIFNTSKRIWSKYETLDYITPVTYKFDLKGSSKALSFKY